MSDTAQSPKKIVVTEETAKQFKGRIPKAIAKEVVAFNKQQKENSPARLQAVAKKKSGELVKKQKSDLFLEEFLRNGGNATQAALKVFNCADRRTAAALGYNYLKEAKSMGRLLLEEKGYTYGKMLTIAAEKAETSRTPEWWDRVMKIAGFEDFISKSGVTSTTVNVMNVQKKMLDEYVTGEVIDALPSEDELKEDA